MDNDTRVKNEKAPPPCDVAVPPADNRQSLDGPDVLFSRHRLRWLETSARYLGLVPLETGRGLH